LIEIKAPGRYGSAAAGLDLAQDAAQAALRKCSAMTLPDFFDRIPTLRVQDPLAGFLGCAVDGELEYSYADAVRLTGHSCPTVAAAYWLSCLALGHLYPDSLPQRGGVRVLFRDGARDGSTGVVAAVVQLLTGAAGSTGFKGLAGKFNRAGLIRFSPDLLLTLRFIRIDTGVAVDVAADLSQVPADARVEPLLARCIEGEASEAEERLLGELWQGRVKRLLLDRAHDPAVYIVRPVDKRAGAARPGTACSDRAFGRPAFGAVQLPL
jgi:hypothetical protein